MKKPKTKKPVKMFEMKGELKMKYFNDSFDYPNFLITNEYAHWNPNDPAAVKSPLWEMTSGSFFSLDGMGWSGPPDNKNPGPQSLDGTNSAVFRLTTKQADFKNVSIKMKLLNQGLSETSSTPPVGWDGIHLFLRYQSQFNLYYASINRRDFKCVIKKKIPGGPSNNGTYFDISNYVTHPWPLNVIQNVTATIRTNPGNSVTIELYEGNTLIVSAVDNGVKGGSPILNPGKVGIRADNCDFKVDDFSVQDLSKRPAPPQ